MDIFDLDIEEFKNKIDEIFDNIPEEELFNDLIENGLIVDEYDSEIYYIEDFFNNVWVHKTKTSNGKKRINMLVKKNKNVDLLEAV